MEFGAFNNVGGAGVAAWQATRLGVRARLFSSGMPAFGSSTFQAYQNAGVKLFYSVKPPGGDVAGMTSGAYDSQLRAAVTGAAAGSLFTVYHEPEDNMGQSTYAAMITHAAQVVHATNPGVQVGYVANVFQWRSGHGYATFNAAAAGVDFLAADPYAYYWNVGPDAATDLKDETGFRAWYGWASQQGFPLRIAEIGIHASDVDGSGTHVFSDDQRAQWLGRALGWLEHHGFLSVSYWNSDAGTSPAGVQWAISGGAASSPKTLSTWLNHQ